jgi:hypothetical protein
MQPDVQDVVEGAFFLEAVGDLADGPDVSAALTRATDATVTLPVERGTIRAREGP